MRLFRSNKSPGSLNISAGRSPLQSPVDTPLQSPAFPPPQSATPGPGPGDLQYDESADPSDAQRFYSSDEQPAQSAQFASSTSRDQNNAGHGYSGRPTVNVIPDPASENSLIPSITTSPTNHEERNQKKANKKNLFSLHSSKGNSSQSYSPSSTLGRSLSTKEKITRPQSQEGLIPQLTTVQYSGEGYSSDTHEENETSNEYTHSQAQADSDEQYNHQQHQFDSPQSQSSSHYSSHYQAEDSHSNSQQNFQKPYQLRPSHTTNTSNSYLPYNPQANRSNQDIHDPYRAIRPPSQQSLGPPSPILSVQQSTEFRSPVIQGRQVTQSNQSSHLQPEAIMARGDGSSASMRQQLAQQHQQGAESGHAQHGTSQGSRQLQQHSSSMTDHGRNTPPPTRSREEFSVQDYTALLQKHEELQAKYSKVKKYYFEKDAQVTALQNTVANQRLSMSRTTLDDHEYTTRFNRLDGAINNLSFNIRKDWKGVPQWLAQMINKDAHNIGTKEMTAVGRACITKWVVDEILDRYFHPRLEPRLSTELKMIEKNIRRVGQNQGLGEEQREDLIVKLISWRLTTLEGLADSMVGEQGHEYKQQLTTMLMEKLTASLQMNLNDPPPPGLESGVGMIIELAIGLAASLPQESRDVCVEYYMPYSLVNETYMKMESGIPPLTMPGGNVDYLSAPEQQQGDQGSTHSGDDNSPGENEGDRENSGGSGLPNRADSLPVQGGNGQQQQIKKDDTRKKSIFGALVSSKKPSQAENSNGGSAGVTNPRTGSGTNVSAKERESMEKAERERRIRFAAFVGVDVRGKGKEGSNVLVKAPCYGF
ncbi:hypothetical protein GJ744_006563 [Endocarpon pusillum]|uniref:Uncharacterized protein n=1 Tax=Endocarpon pusillum TaxID=364733 RepID=A0A8H7AUU6_9EURO|nr:hypothetical protein GJ744_006563 [Endocarpon pusillum]